MITDGTVLTVTSFPPQNKLDSSQFGSWGIDLQYVGTHSFLYHTSLLRTNGIIGKWCAYCLAFLEVA